MNFWDVFFDWPALMSRGTDVVVYFCMAAVGSLLFILRLAFSLFGGHGHDMDMDGGSHLDGVDSDASFSMFSLLSILAFFMGAGWMGLASRFDFELGSLASAVISSGFGLAMMLLASGLAYSTRRLNKNIHYDMQTAVGKTGRVYLSIPAKGQGDGQVEVSISGRRMVKRAVSKDQKIEAFTDVTVVDVFDDETLVVEPKA